MEQAQTFLLVAADFVKTGGMDRANYALAEHLAGLGVEVHLVGHSAGAGLRARPEVHWHRVRRPLGRDALGWGALSRAGRRWAQRIAAGGGRVLVNGGNCRWGDLNWVHYVHAAYRAPAEDGAGRQLWSAYKHRRALRDERRALVQARVVIANSRRTRQDLIARLGVEAERIHTIYYGCDGVRFAPVSAAKRSAERARRGWAAAGRTALFVGALGDRRKGFDTLLEAWQRLCAHGGWDVDLAVAGRGREVDDWRRRAAAAGLAERILFMGFRRDIPELLAACDILVAPTRYEAYGLGVQEALARGLPALVSAQAGVAERYPGGLRHWLLEDPESVEELEAALLRWRSEINAGPAAWAVDLAALGAELRAHSWERMSAEIAALAGVGAAVDAAQEPQA